MQYVEVALNVPLNQTFTYSVLPENSDGRLQNECENGQIELELKKRKKAIKTFEAQIGKRAEVKFGNRRLTGIITKVFDELPKDLSFDKSKIRPVIRILDDIPLLT